MTPRRSSTSLLVVTSFALVAVVGWVRPARAAVSVPTERLPSWFVELTSGVSVPSFEAYGDLGFAFRATAGLGADFEGLPFALYITASVTGSFFSDTRHTTWHTAELAQTSWVFALGFRGIAKLGERLDVLLDLEGGYRSAGASAVIDGTETYEMSEGHALPVIGAGARYRMTDWLLIGLRWETHFLQPLDGPDVPATAAGYATPRGERWQMNIMLSGTARF